MATSSERGFGSCFLPGDEAEPRTEVAVLDGDADEFGPPTEVADGRGEGPADGGVGCSRAKATRNEARAEGNRPTNSSIKSSCTEKGGENIVSLAVEGEGRA